MNDRALSLAQTLWLSFSSHHRAQFDRLSKGNQDWLLWLIDCTPDPYVEQHIVFEVWCALRPRPVKDVS